MHTYIHTYMHTYIHTHTRDRTRLSEQHLDTKQVKVSRGQGTRRQTSCRCPASRVFYVATWLEILSCVAYACTPRQALLDHRATFDH